MNRVIGKAKRFVGLQGGELDRMQLLRAVNTTVVLASTAVATARFAQMQDDRRWGSPGRNIAFARQQPALAVTQLASITLLHVIGAGVKA